MSDFKPDGYNIVTPYAIVLEPDKLIAFLTNVLEGEVILRVVDDERVRHAEVKVGDSVVMMGGVDEQNPPFPLMAYVYVPDVDETYRRALENGAASLQEPADQFYGDRTAGVVDSQGNTWYLATRVEEVSEEEIEERVSARQS